MKKLLRRAWIHVAFFRPLKFPEFEPGTKEAMKWVDDERAMLADLEKLAEATLRELLDAKLLELQQIRQDLDQTRQRAAQLLAVTGVLGVLGSLLPTLPTPLGMAWLKGIVLGVIAYLFAGTIWLTIGALRVSPWDTVKTDVPPPGRRQMRVLLVGRVRDAFRVNRNLRLRLNGPTGYLRDAYYFFGITAVGIACLLILRNALG